MELFLWNELNRHDKTYGVVLELLVLRAGRTDWSRSQTRENVWLRLFNTKDVKFSAGTNGCGGPGWGVAPVFLTLASCFLSQHLGHGDLE